MAGENQVGAGYIELIPELDNRRLARTTDQIRAHLKGMGRAVDKEWKAQNQDLIGEASRQFKSLHKGQAEGIFRAHRAEIKSSQSLQKQRQSAMSGEQRDQQRRISELDKWYKDKNALDARAMAESKRAQKAFASEMDKLFSDSVMKGVGATPTPPKPGAAGRLGYQAATPPPTSPNVGALGTSAANLDRLSSSLSQLSTRIGIASFQMQMLGVMLTTAVTGPALMAFGGLARSGLQFAVNIDYARASMKALLKPSDDVEQILNDIKQISIDSPMFAAQDAIQYAQQIAAVGVKGRDLTRTMQAMSNIFLTQGVAGPERAKLAMLAYTQILSKGKIGMDDLRQQFAEHVPGGIKIFEQVALTMGYKSIKALNKGLVEGKVSMVDLNEAFIKFGNSEKYVTGAANAAQTLGGVWQAFTEEIVSTVGSAFDRNRAQIINAINGIRPVVMAFINWFVAALPAMIQAVNNLVIKIRGIKAAYDALNPETQKVIQQLGLMVLVAGPASVALGILGTALSTVANAASLLVKVLSLATAGGSLGVLGVLMTTVAVAAVVLGGAMVYLYNKSAPFRKVFLQVANLLKDAIGTIILPLVDALWGAIVSLGRTFEGLGLKTEHLAYALLILGVPIAMVALALGVLLIVVKAIQIAVAVLISAFDALMHILASTMYTAQALMEALANIPGPLGESAGQTGKDIQALRDGMVGLVDTTGAWKTVGTGADSVTQGLQQTLANTDLTATGLAGVFDHLGLGVDDLTKKEIGLEEALQNARRAMDAQGSAAAGAADANDAYKRAKLALTESVDRNGRSLTDNSRASLDNRDALKSAGQASYEKMLQDIRSGVPMDKAIARHKARTNQLIKEFGANKATNTAAKTLIDTYAKVPKDVKTLLGIMGYKDVNARMIELLVKQRTLRYPETSAAAVRAAIAKQERIKAATGGLVRGPGGPVADKIPAMLSNKEYVVKASATRAVGTGILDYINRYGDVPAMYARGGLAQTWPYKADVSKTKIPQILEGGGGSGQVARMMSILRNAFPGLALISGYRPGAITSTGNKSYHGMGRAVDVPPRWDVFSWIKSTYGAMTKELIFTPAGDRQIKNGREHVFSGGTIKQDHNDHVHWAYDNGGVIPPGAPFVNNSNSAELALNSAQGSALEDRIRDSDRKIDVAVYVDGVRRDAEIVWNEKADELTRALGGGA